MVPGETGCFACASPLAFVEDKEKDTKKRRLMCCFFTDYNGDNGWIFGLKRSKIHVKLNSLFFLLIFSKGFGNVSHRLSYQARTEYFQNY